MGDMADDFRALRESKRKYRAQMPECPNCDFGGNAPKVPHGMTCRHCGWQAPEQDGSRSR